MDPRVRPTCLEERKNVSHCLAVALPLPIRRLNEAERFSSLSCFADEGELETAEHVRIGGNRTYSVLHSPHSQMTFPGIHGRPLRMAGLPV